MYKVIIIGANGMLGQSLVEEFSGRGIYQVKAWDMTNLDITNQEQVDKLISEERPDIIINAAAYNAVDQAEEDKEAFELAKKVNGRGPEYLAQIAKKIGAIFVHYVTDYVFDGKKGEYIESDEPNPISKYGQSKELGERKVVSIGGKYYLIRTSKLFGNPGKGENVKKSFFEVMLNLAKEKDVLKVVDEEKSCFTYVSDLARATRELIEEKYKFGIYHIINEGAVTWLEGVKALFKIAGVENIKLIGVNSDEFKRPAKRPRASVLINTKFKKLRNYEEALVEWFKKSGRKIK